MAKNRRIVNPGGTPVFCTNSVGMIRHAYCAGRPLSERLSIPNPLFLFKPKGEITIHYIKHTIHIQTVDCTKNKAHTVMGQPDALNSHR